jgi:hypothetical protein
MQYEKIFNNIIHSDFKNRLFISVDNFNTNLEKVSLLDENFEVLIECEKGFLGDLLYFLKDEEALYKAYRNSNNVNQRIIAFISRKNGSRSSNDWREIDESDNIEILKEYR